MKILGNGIIRDSYQVVVIGAGIGGLTAAAMLAKRGVQTLLIEQHYMPGGTCGAIRRRDFTMDIGATVLYGFGINGFTTHRFVMNELEEEIDMIPRQAIYHMHLGEREITFWRDFEKFLQELMELFPGQKRELRNFYDYLYKLYGVVVANDLIVPPTELSPVDGLKTFLKNPVGTMQLGMLMFKNAKSIFEKFFTDPHLIDFFDMLTRTFSYVDAVETPAVLSATMFTDNHEGGAYYPAGSPQTLSNKLEKAVEKYGGQILYRHMVDEILIDRGAAFGVRLTDGTEIRGRQLISDADVWNLYGRLVRPRHIRPKRMEWAHRFVPTHSNLMLYLGIDAEALPEWVKPMEIFIDDPGQVAGHGITMYVSSLVDPSICPPGCHSVTVAVVSGEKWPRPEEPVYRSDEYRRKKEKEADLVLGRIEKHIPGFRRHIKFMEIGTPSTIERYTRKSWGNTGGPKQMIGQEMMKRLHAKSDWENLFLCGDSTVMGLGVLPATVSGVGAANLVLKELGKPGYKSRKFSRQYVNFVTGSPRPPIPGPSEPITEEGVKRLARECQYCENPGCARACPAGIDLAGFFRRVETGNFAGAVRSMREMNPLAEICGYVCPVEKLCEKECNRKEFSDRPVKIKDLQAWVCGRVSSHFGWERSVPKANNHRVAVVGAGPAGLTCAHFLARLGYRVEIREKTGQAGGMMTRAIPTFRLPEEVVAREVKEIAFPGVDFRYGQELGKDFSVSDLLKEYHAVFLATGLGKGKSIKLPGADKVEVEDALSFLARYRSKGGAEMKPRVLVVGGGSVASDAALAAKMSGAAKVSLACLEKEEEMPALKSEVAELRKHGIELNFCLGPNAFPNPNKLSFFVCKSVYDASGNFCPAFDESQVVEFEFDQVVMAVGQEVEPSLSACLEREFGRPDLVEVEENSLQVKGHPGLYAGGDIIRGAGMVVQAATDGRKAAMEIDLYLRGRSG